MVHCHSLLPQHNYVNYVQHSLLVGAVKSCESFRSNPSLIGQTITASTMHRDYHVWHSPYVTRLFQHNTLDQLNEFIVNSLNLVHNSILGGTWWHTYESSTGKTTVMQIKNHSSVWWLASTCTTVGMCNQPGSSARLVFLCFLFSVLTPTVCLGTVHWQAT